MEATRTCDTCGATLPADAPKGLCPHCLVQIGFAATSIDSSAAVSGALDNSASKTAVLPRTRIRYFGDYELLDKIAHGGMGVVYKARQVSLNRTVAVKMILTGQLAGPAEVQRFLTEAEAAANLQHPNIVAIHEVGEHDGQHYFSMDYVEGDNLAEHLRRHSMPAVTAAELIKTLAEAVHFAHQRGTLHRD